MLQIKGFRIHAPQDPGVGMYPINWELTGDFYFEGKAHLEEFREELRRFFADYADDGRTKVRTIEEEEEEDRRAEEMEKADEEERKKG